MRTVIVNRDIGDDNQKLGVCYVKDECNVIFKSESIERGWLNNQRNVSCVPPGEYELVLEWSPRFKQHLWELKGVPGRSECKFHAVNFARDLNGCIGLGEHRTDIDKDGYKDVTNSRNTMRDFHKAMGNEKKAKVVISDI